MITYVKGDLIKLAQAGEFNVIAHGCNCFCTMARGIAPLMAAAFHVDGYELEAPRYKGDIDKLGRIEGHPFSPYLRVYNFYTQYHWGLSGGPIPLDYDALHLCFRKLKMELHQFGVRSTARIGLPKIGCGLAGGDWKVVSTFLDSELGGFDLTVVEL